MFPVSRRKWNTALRDVSADGLTPAQQLGQIRQQNRALVDEQARCLTRRGSAGAKRTGIQLVHYESLSRHEKEKLKEYFIEKVFPVLTPLAVDPSHPFPYISPLSVNIGLMVEAPEDEAVGPWKRLEPRFVRIKVPSVCAATDAGWRFGITVRVARGDHRSEHERCFPGWNRASCHRFRVTRDADIEIREEEAEDLLSVIQEELRRRRFGAPVRLEVSTKCPRR